MVRGMVRLAGKVAIVTGAGEGIGRGIARRFAREAASVVVGEVRPEWGERTVDELTALGANARFVRTDVGVKRDVERLVETAVDVFGGVDVLVNNAQTFTPMVPLEEKQDDWMDTSLRSGLYGSFWAMQAAFPHMRDRGGGSIVNFCSLNGVTGAWYSVDYNATKEAIRGLTRSAAREWGPYGIRVNAIGPGAASSGYRAWADRNPADAAAGEAMIPLGRMGDPEEDIGGVALFLASDDGQYVTGQTIFADGGGHLGSGWRPPRSTKPDGLGHWVADDSA
jgi:NAD(P)-dependent dehydrogenase (short-subunit alcohol dehydrogenase family)